MIDYKRIFRDEETRYKILNMLSFIPDSVMVKIQYRIKMGRKLNIVNPKRYSEKLQWYKVYYRNSLMTKCSDKYTVRSYVKSKGLDNILNKLYGVYDAPSEIKWSDLPKKFVLKDTLGGGGRSMIFVYDKNKLDKSKANEIMNSWISTPANNKGLGREWVYENQRHRIIAEELLIGEGGDLPDYKFFCFNGRIFCSYMMKNYTLNHANGVLGFFDKDFRLLQVRRTDFKRMEEQPDKPINYDRMVEYAEILSDGFPHVRVDFYNLNGRIVFGEMTFFNASGYVSFDPDEFDYEMGKHFVLPKRNN